VIRGTRIIEGEEARLFGDTLATLRTECLNRGFEEIFLPSLADPTLWTGRSGVEIEKQMWQFPDRKERPVCLQPEATAVIQNLYDESWSKSRPKPIRLFYTAKCYRYERPQAGRYREFTQFGLEILGPDPYPEMYEENAKWQLRECLAQTGVKYDFDDQVERGLSYYSRNGFEARVETLGAQKQIAGGGVYKQGVGWAIGVDRLVLALQQQKRDELNRAS
jgi:histidyl-tRNA synthetase